MDVKPETLKMCAMHPRAGTSLAGILAVLLAGGLDMKATLAGKQHYLLYCLTPAMKPRMLMTGTGWWCCRACRAQLRGPVRLVCCNHCCRSVVPIAMKARRRCACANKLCFVTLHCTHTCIRCAAFLHAPLHAPMCACIVYHLRRRPGEDVPAPGQLDLI